MPLFLSHCLQPAGAAFQTLAMAALIVAVLRRN